MNATGEDVDYDGCTTNTGILECTAEHVPGWSEYTTRGTEYTELLLERKRKCNTWTYASLYVDQPVDRLVDTGMPTYTRAYLSIDRAR